MKDFSVWIAVLGAFSMPLFSYADENGKNFKVLHALTKVLKAASKEEIRLANEKLLNENQVECSVENNGKIVGYTRTEKRLINQVVLSFFELNLFSICQFSEDPL